MKSSASVPLRSNASPAFPYEFGRDPAVASSFWSVSFASALFGIFILYSRFFDFAGSNLQIPRLALSAIILFYLMSGRPLVFVQSVTGKIMLVMVGWLSLTVITSVWKSSSASVFYEFIQCFLTFVLAASLPLAMKNVRKIMSTLAVAGLTTAAMVIPWGVHSNGRLALRNGNLGDPNYYAMVLVAVVPFFWSMAKSAESYAVKIFAWVALVPIFAVVAQTGSRGSMLGFGVMILVLFIISPFKTKLLIFGATVAGLLMAVAVMPGYIRERYLTFFEVSSGPAQAMQVEAGGDGLSDSDRLHSDTTSAMERRRLLMTSIALTMEHPLVGVGPGNFPEAVWAENKAAGIVYNQWLVTHNAYTQISSEMGIPGLIIFLALIGTGLKSILWVLKRSKETGEKPDEEANSTAKYLLLSTTGLCVCIFFLAVGYEVLIYIWMGMAVSLRRTFEEKRVETEEVVEAPPAPILPEKRAFQPAFAKSQNRLPQRETPTVAGRPVRFNRFR